MTDTTTKRHAKMWCCGCVPSRPLCWSPTISCASSPSCGHWRAPRSGRRAPVARGHRRRARPTVLRHGARAGDVYEMEAPWPDVADERVRRICLSMAEQLAAIHRSTSMQTGLGRLDDGSAIWTASSITGPRRCIGSARIRCLRWNDLLKVLRETKPAAVLGRSPSCTAMPSRATSRSSATTSARSSTGR